MERKDSDRPELEDRSDTSPTANSVGSQVGLPDRLLNCIVRNLHAA